MALAEVGGGIDAAPVGAGLDGIVDTCRVVFPVIMARLPIQPCLVDWLKRGSPHPAPLGAFQAPEPIVYFWMQCRSGWSEPQRSWHLMDCRTQDQGC
jgi:hypothetical protein